MYRPPQAAEMTTPLILQIPTGKSTYNGVRTKTSYTDAAGVIFANFKTYGGTDLTVDGVREIEDTAQVVCWYRPDLTSNCRIKRAEDGAVYEILGEPEDIEQRHQFLSFKVRRIKGGV